MDKISFSLRGAFKEGWNLFKKNAQFLLIVSLALFLFKIVGNGKEVTLASSIAGVASFILYLVLLKAALAIAKNPVTTLPIKSFATFLPTLREFFGFIAVSIVAGVISLVGLSLILVGVLFHTIVIPLVVVGGIIIIIGIYFSLRLLLANYFFIEAGLSIRGALRAAWRATKNNSVANKTIIVLICAGIFSVLGVIVFGIGVLVTYPVGLLVIAQYYYAAKKYGITDVAPQLTEIPPTQM